MLTASLNWVVPCRAELHREGGLAGHVDIAVRAKAGSDLGYEEEGDGNPALGEGSAGQVYDTLLEEGSENRR